MHHVANLYPPDARLNRNKGIGGLGCSCSSAALRRVDRQLRSFRFDYRRGSQLHLSVSCSYYFRMASMAQTRFINRFIDFFLIEQRLKWKVYLTSVGVASVWAVLRLSLTDKSEEEISLEAAILLCLLVMISVIAYVAKGRLFPPKAEELRPYPCFSLRFGLAGAAGLVLMAAMVKIDVPKMQAAMIDFRLKTFATFLNTVQAANLSEQQLRDRYKKIESIAAVASTNQIPVDPNVLQKAQTAISTSLRQRSPSEQTKQLGWTTSIDLESLAYARMVQTGAITPVSLRQIANVGYVMNSPLFIDNRNINVLGDHSLIALGPGGGQFILNQSTVVFDKIDFQGSVSVPAIELVGNRSNAIVRDSIMKLVTQYLERITWVDVRFENSRILYTEGAPLRLSNVSFKDCDLSHLGFPPAWGPVSEELKKRIEEANGQPITFVYEPQPQ
jgi:hypothetical protein